MKLAWIMLLLAGVFEIGWPVGLKNGYSEGSTNLTWIGFAIICMAISGTPLFMAQKTIPIGTAYAVWTGIGAAGTFMVGIWFYGDGYSMVRLLSVFLIIAGVIGLKVAS